MKYTTVLLALSFAVMSYAHMHMDYPPEFDSKFNPHANEKDWNYNVMSPLNSTSLALYTMYPCKSYQVAMDDPTGEGASVANWKQGGSYKFTLGSDGSPHEGGSCQISLSYDHGVTFTVIHTYLGHCSDAGDHPFVLPSDTPVQKDVIFAWYDIQINYI